MAISLTSEQGPVTGATVDVRGRTGRKGPLSEPVPAPGNFLQPWSYELDMNLREPGRWNFEIKIDGSLGETVFEVPLEVAAEPGQETSGGPKADNQVPGVDGPNWVLISGIVAALILGSGGWVFLQRQHPRRGMRRRRR